MTVATYYQRSTTSDLTGPTGTGGTTRHLVASQTAGGTTAPLASGNMNAGLFCNQNFFTPSGDPGATGLVGKFTAKARVTAASAGETVGIRAFLARYNSDGVLQGSEVEANEGSQTAIAATTRTYTWNNPALGTWAAGDRLLLRFQITNTSGTMNQAATIDVDTADDTLAVADAWALIGSGTGLTPSLTVQTGDLLVAVGGDRSGGTTASVTDNGTAGWTQAFLVSHKQADATYRTLGACYVKVAAAGDAGTLGVTIGGDLDYGLAANFRGGPPVDLASRVVKTASTDFVDNGNANVTSLASGDTTSLTSGIYAKVAVVVIKTNLFNDPWSTYTDGIVSQATFNGSDVEMDLSIGVDTETETGVQNITASGGSTTRSVILGYILLPEVGGAAGTEAPAGNAASAGAANTSAVTIGAGSGAASSTGIANTPTPSIAAQAGLAAATGSAPQPTADTGGASANAPAGAAEATGAANPGISAVGAQPAAPTATGTANPATPDLEASAGTATATGSAPGATVETGTFTNAPAGLAAATGTAGTASIDIDALAASATAAGTAPQPETTIGPHAGLAASVGTAPQAAAQFGAIAPAGLASAAGTAGGPSIDIDFTAGLALAAGEAGLVFALTGNPLGPGRAVTVKDPAGTIVEDPSYSVTVRDQPVVEVT